MSRMGVHINTSALPSSETDVNAATLHRVRDNRFHMTNLSLVTILFILTPIVFLHLAPIFHLVNSAVPSLFILNLTRHNKPAQPNFARVTRHRATVRTHERVVLDIPLTEQVLRHALLLRPVNVDLSFCTWLVRFPAHI
jgi:hypothetical protein